MVLGISAFLLREDPVPLSYNNRGRGELTIGRSRSLSIINSRSKGRALILAALSSVARMRAEKSRLNLH